MQRVSPTYICVGKGASKEVKKARLAFEKLTAGERAFHITEAALLPAPSGVLESLLYSGKKAQKDIGSIATSLL
jgi:hypothetical protein